MKTKDNHGIQAQRNDLRAGISLKVGAPGSALLEEAQGARASGCTDVLGDGHLHQH